MVVITLEDIMVSDPVPLANNFLTVNPSFPLGMLSLTFTCFSNSSFTGSHNNSDHSTFESSAAFGVTSFAGFETSTFAGFSAGFFFSTCFVNMIFCAYFFIWSSVLWKDGKNSCAKICTSSNSFFSMDLRSLSSASQNSLFPAFRSSTHFK